MSEIGDMFKAIKEIRQIKRRTNLAKNTEILVEKGVHFESFNWGSHLKVRGYDFWPSTGKIMLSGVDKGRGIKRLLQLLEQS